MSARDDATSPPSATRAPRACGRVTAVMLVGACLGAALTGALADRYAPDRLPRYEARVRWQGGPPVPGEWPRPARPGESAVPCGRADGTLLAVRSFTRAGTGALARDLRRRRLSGMDTSSARRASARAQWRAQLAPGGLPPLSATAECAALIRARLLLVVLVDRDVTPAEPVPAPASASARLEQAEAEVVRLALAARPDSLAAALTACAVAEGGWLCALAGEPASDPRVRLEAAWRWHEWSRAPVLDRVERALESALPPALRAAVPPASFERALMLERQAPDPAAMLFVHGAWGPPREVLPIARTWVALLAGGAFAGALSGLGLGLLLPGSRARRGSRVRVAHGVPEALRPHASDVRLAPLARDPRQARHAELSWLHVVCGPDPARIGRAVAMLAGEFLERGERVLALDAGRRLRLHERFGGDTRWGLGECLAGGVPLLGAVQAAGRPGFYFLAHGAPGRAEGWDGLSGLLEEARSHFGRVILALDPRVPRAAALPLGGRVLEAWWAEPGSDLPRGAIRLSERLGIPFACLDLNSPTQAVLEGERIAPASEMASSSPGAEGGLAQPAGFAVEGIPSLADMPPGADAATSVEDRPAPAAVSGVAAPADAGSPVLGCDLEVRERLRFLIWMRRARAAGRLTAFGTGAGG